MEDVRSQWIYYKKCAECLQQGTKIKGVSCVDTTGSRRRLMGMEPESMELHGRRDCCIEAASILNKKNEEDYRSAVCRHHKKKKGTVCPHELQEEEAYWRPPVVLNYRSGLLNPKGMKRCKPKPQCEVVGVCGTPDDTMAVCHGTVQYDTKAGCVPRYYEEEPNDRRLVQEG
jgi:hypothetical protein